MKVLTKKNIAIINIVVALKRLLGRFCLTRKFVVKRHPTIKDAILVGSYLGERNDGEPEVLFYKNEKTGEIFSEPEYYYEIIKRGQNSA